MRCVFRAIFQLPAQVEFITTKPIVAESSDRVEGPGVDENEQSSQQPFRVEGRDDDRNALASTVARRAEMTNRDPGLPSITWISAHGRSRCSEMVGFFIPCRLSRNVKYFLRIRFCAMKLTSTMTFGNSFFSLFHGKDAGLWLLAAWDCGLCVSDAARSQVPCPPSRDPWILG